MKKENLFSLAMGCLIVFWGLFDLYSIAKYLIILYQYSPTHSISYWSWIFAAEWTKGIYAWLFMIIDLMIACTMTIGGISVILSRINGIKIALASLMANMLMLIPSIVAFALFASGLAAPNLNHPSWGGLHYLHSLLMNVLWLSLIIFFLMKGIVLVAICLWLKRKLAYLSTA